MPAVVGLARTEITPPLGAPLGGYFTHRFASGVHDPLWCKSLCIATEGGRLLLTACDLLGLDSEAVQAAEQAAGLGSVPEEHTFLCCTHTHLGPQTLQVLADTRDVTYLRRLPWLIAETIQRASSDQWPASLAVGASEARGISFNRRFRMRDGSVRTNPGILNPDILGPVGPTDPEVLVLLVRDAQARPRAVVCNFALHLDTIGGDVVSADYPYFLSQRVRQDLGAEVEVIFVNGAAGDINHIDVTRERPFKGFELAEDIGKRLGEAVLQACASAVPLQEVRVRGARQLLELPVREITQDMVRRARTIVEKEESSIAGVEDQTEALGLSWPTSGTVAQVYAREWLLLHERGSAPVQADIRAACLSPEVALVGIPGELFCELGLRIKRDSPFPRTFVTSLTNGEVGYIPTRRAFEEGGYETIPARSSPLAPGAGEMVAEAALELLHRVRGQLG